MSRPGRGVAGFALVAALAWAAACARVGTLEGGPPDREPPHLLLATPRDSTTNLPRLPRFELQFSEPLGATAARRAVRIEPQVRLADVRAHGTMLRVTLAESLPPDTTVVLILGTALQDRAGRDNKLAEEIALVYSTGATLRGASVLGRVTVKGVAAPHVAVRWEAMPGDTARALPLRRGPVAAANAEGLFRLAGVPPNRRFVLRGFVDRNEDLLPGEDELAVVCPETLLLAPGAVRRGLAWNIFDPNEPGQVAGVVLNQTAVAGPVAIALRQLGPMPGAVPLRADSTQAVPESATVRADTVRPRALPVPPRAASPWASAYAALEPRGFVRRDWVVVYASPRGDYSVRVPPGKHVVFAFVEARRDSAPGLYVVADTTALAWEPLVRGDTVLVTPGAKLRARTLEIRGP